MRQLGEALANAGGRVPERTAEKERDLEMAARCQKGSVHRCPTDVSHVADLYLLGRLTPEEADTFEEHFLQCTACDNAVQLAYDFIMTLKNFVSSLRARRGVRCESQMRSRISARPIAGSAV
jgi:hypothetical protein